MNVVFTEQAVERMRQRDIAGEDVSSLLNVFEGTTNDLQLLSNAGVIVRVGTRHGSDSYIIQAGDLQAVVTVDPTLPGRLIVTSVYRIDDTNLAESRSALMSKAS